MFTQQLMRTVAQNWHRKFSDYYIIENFSQAREIIENLAGHGFYMVDFRIFDFDAAMAIVKDLRHMGFKVIVDDKAEEGYIPIFVAWAWGEEG